MIYKLHILTLDSKRLYSKEIDSETRANDLFNQAKQLQHLFKIDTIAVLFEDNVVIQINEHKWIEWQGSPPIRQRVTHFKPSPEQQERFRQVLQHLNEI